MMIDDNAIKSYRSVPKTEQELLNRCQSIAGKTLGMLAAELAVNVPENLQRHKGWVGGLLEQYLGADAGNQAAPDFVDLSIEMKTLPLNKHGQPKESTYVCMVPMQQTGDLSWQKSWVREKLAKVLWVPIEAEPSIPLAERYIGNVWLWQPTVEQEQQLKQDWEELMDRIVLGEQAQITAKEGEYLQLRPKAGNSRILAKGVSEMGSYEQVNPKGFYLRSSFTQKLYLDSCR